MIVEILDAEKIVSDYLREDATVAAIVGRRVVGKTPDSITEPWVRLTQLDAREPGGHRSDYFIRYYLQLDCYAGDAGGQPQANALGRAVRRALVEMSSSTVTVSGVDIRSHSRNPDPDFNPDRERVVITAFVWMHS